MTKPLRVGLIGQKFMGKAHSNAWGQASRFFDLPRNPVLDCVAARNRDELAAFAARWGWERFTTRWQDMVGDEALDLIDVATPNFLHALPAIGALEAGQHVTCEKPLASDLESARAMRDVARKAKRRGVHSFVWFNYRRCPAIGTAWKLIREGRLGDILHVRATYLQSWGGPETPLSWRFKKKTAGSGAHGDLNAHIVDLARFLTGDEIERVHGAVARTFVKERPLVEDPKKTGRSNVDDCVAFVASMKGGATATFEATRLAPGHQNRNCIEINGSKGSIAWDFEDMNVLRFFDAADGDREGGWRRIMCTSAGNHPYLEAWWPDAHVIGYEHGFTNMVADICRAIGGQEPELPLPDFDDAYQTQRVLEAALLAAKEGRAVRLSEVK